MPVYSLTSPKTGRTYDIDIAHGADNPPPPSVFEEIGQQLDAQIERQQAVKPFFRLGDTLSGIGTALGGLPETLTASAYRLKEGTKRPDEYSAGARAAFDAEAKFSAEVAKDSQNRLLRGEASSTGESLRDAAPSLGFSGISMGASIVGNRLGAPVGALIGGIGGAPAGPAAVGTAGVGATVGGVLGGMAASGAAAYRMAANQFMDDAWNRVGAQREKQGLPWTEKEKAEAYAELLPLAQNAGLWEAGPEALGNAFGMAAGKYVLGLGKKGATELAENIWKKLGKKGAALVGGGAMELTTETATQLGAAPAQAQADAYAQGAPDWQQASSPYDRPGGTVQAFKDVAPATLAQSALMLGMGGAYKAGRNILTHDTPTTTPAPPQTPGTATSPAPLGGVAGAVPSTLSRIAAESVAPDDDTGALTAEEVQDLERSAATPGRSVPEAGRSARAPLETPLTPGERAPADQTAQDAIAGVIAAPAQTITGSNVQTGTEMPVPSPTANAGAGTGAIVSEPPPTTANNGQPSQTAPGPLEPLLLPKNFTGGLAGQLQAAASNNRQPPPPAANNGQLLASAYTAAAQGSSSQMVPIRAVYEQARAQNPALTPAQFMADVQAGDAAGTVMLEPFDTPQGLQAAGEFVARNASGVPSTGMMVVESLRNPAAQNAEAPGGLSEAETEIKSMLPTDVRADYQKFDQRAPILWRGENTFPSVKSVRIVGADSSGKSRSIYPSAAITLSNGGVFVKRFRVSDHAQVSETAFRHYDLDYRLTREQNESEKMFDKRILQAAADDLISAARFAWEDQMKQLRPLLDKNYGAALEQQRSQESQKREQELKRDDAMRFFRDDTMRPVKVYRNKFGWTYQDGILKDPQGNKLGQFSNLDTARFWIRDSYFESSRAAGGTLQSPAELAAASAANVAKLKALGLPTQAGTRVWAKGKVQTALGRIAKDASYPATMRKMAELLQRVNLDNLLLKIEADGRLNFSGKYQPYNNGRGEISLNTRVSGRGETDIVQSLVHELLHHATYRALRGPKNATQSQAIKDLESLRKRALAALSAQELGIQFDYELSNTDEFIAALFTRADFQTALAGIPLEQAPTLGQRFRSVLDEIFRTLGELVTGRKIEPGSVLEASFAATLRIMEEGQGAADMQPMPALLNPAEGSIPEGMAETQSRWRSPNQPENLYEVEPVAVAQAAGVAWLNQTSVEEALSAFENAVVPPGMTQARMFYAHGELIKRLSQQLTHGNEVQRMQANNLLLRAGAAWHGKESQEWGRAGKARAVVSDELQGFAPILAAQNVLIDRAEALGKARFDGGAEGVKTKIEKILADADLDISERVERILATVMQSALKPITSIKEAVAALMPGKSQREQMIEDVAQALMVKARGNVVTPERKTALAALAASLKQTLGASVQGDASKAAASPLGEVLARAFVDQVSEGQLFTEAWQAGRQSVFDMFYDMELDKAFHPARMRAEQAAARLKQLEAGSTEQQAANATERAELKTTLAELKAEMLTAKAKADGMTDTFWQQVGRLMPATPTMAYAPGMSKEAIKRGFEQAGYTAEIKTGMKQSGTRTLNVQDALRDPQRAMTAVLKVWDAEAQAAGIDPAAWQEGRKLAWQALNETLNEWQTKAAERAAKLAQAQKDALMAKDSPALVTLLKLLAGKIAPGMSWTEIFTDLQGTQKERQRAIYDRLLKDERLQSLTQDERIALTNELDKAWMRERRTVFNRELQKAGILGEKKASDRQKVKNAMPKLLRLINLGMFNSEMFREAIAPEYGLRVIDAKTAAKLRGLAEAAYAEPAGVLRNRKLGSLLTAMQSATGSTVAELVSNYWTAAVLSGLRTQFDTWMAGLNGLGTNLIQAAGLLARGQGKSAVDAHLTWWRGLIDGTRESLQILAKGDYSVLKRFGTDLNKALKGESQFRPLPLGESLWKNGNAFQKYAMAPVMIWTGRLMAAADHINNTATTAGAMAVARALHPEYYGRTTFSEAEQTNARAQALREVTGGSEPVTAADKATVSVRVRELLYGSMRETERLEANEIGDMAAFQNDPTGVFGTVHAAMKAGLGTVQRTMEEKAQDMEANKLTRGMLGLLAGSLHGLTGTRFMRFGFNFGAELTRYVPGTAIMDRATAGGLYGKETGPMQRELLIGKNLVGLMLGSTLAALFLTGDDDDEGWQIEGDWSVLTPQQKAERMAAGMERLTMWKRDGDKVRRVSYKQWPTMGIFAVVGGMLDEKRHKPAQWAQHGTAGHLLRGMGTGMMQIKNVSAMRNLVEIFGGSRLAGDPSTGILDDVAKVGTNFAGGFIPTAMKDAEVWNDPRNFKAEGWTEELQRSLPIARRFVNDGRPQLNLLGEEVKLQRAPWSRGYTSVPASEASRVLGALLSRGLNLPQPSDAVMVYQNGVKVPLDKLGREKVWQYEKAVGTAYKAWLNTEGSALLQMPVPDADKVIDARTRAIKQQALARVTR